MFLREKSRHHYVSGGIFSLIEEFLTVNDKNHDSDTEKQDSDEIFSENDFGSLYVSDELFFELIKIFTRRLNDNQQ